MNEKGVWRTIRGRRVFIKDGEDLESAMKRSGKFGKSLKETRDLYNNEIKKEQIENRRISGERNYAKRKYGELSEEYEKWDNEFKNSQDRIAKLQSDSKIAEHETINRITRVDLPNEFGIEVKENQLENLRKAGREARAREIDKINSDTYQSKVFGTDVTKMDKQMKDLFGEDFKYDEDKINQPVGEQTRQLIKEMNVKTFADEIKESKTIHTQSGSYSESELKSRDESIKQMYKDTWSGNKSYKDLHTELESMKSQGKISQGELDALKYDASRETDNWQNNPKNAHRGKYVGNNTVKMQEDKIKKDLSRPYIEQPDGTYADPKSPFTKRTSSELRKQIKELEPYTEELQVGNRVIINTGGGKYGVRNVGDEDDPMTDYSAYVYGFNAKMIIQRAREQGIVTDTPKTSKTTEAKVERFKERKGKTLDTMSKRQLAEKLVEDQIARGVVKSENKEMLIKKKMQDYSKSDLLDYFK